ncbi:MAG: hypothetical protein KGI71_06275 [Patescibacteria group bacterium]|nr:hypothetical protein [Patescibacteria group bacterium]
MDQQTVVLRYVNPATGEEATWTAPAPCAPALVRAIDAAFAARGFVRVEEP